MSSVTLDKFAEQINSMRADAERKEPGMAARIQVYITASSSKHDTTYPDLLNVTEGAHFHRPGETGVIHTELRAVNWPECVILK